MIGRRDGFRPRSLAKIGWTKVKSSSESRIEPHPYPMDERRGEVKRGEER